MKNKTTFKYEYEGRTIEMVLPVDMSLDEMCEQFQFFLSGCGYNFEGKRIELVYTDNDDELTPDNG